MDKHKEAQDNCTEFNIKTSYSSHQKFLQHKNAVYILTREAKIITPKKYMNVMNCLLVKLLKLPFLFKMSNFIIMQINRAFI